MNSLIIPVYRNAESIPELLTALHLLCERLQGNLEVVFVVDGSPDASHRLLEQALLEVPFDAQLVAHSRNFGSFAAIRTGLALAKGDCFAVMAADLQEPIELAEEFFRRLEADEADVLLGSRDDRDDPLPSRLASQLFWSLYRLSIMPEIPKGGVDVFACNRGFRKELLALEESHSSLVGLIFWLGFRRAFVPYHRLARPHGQSAWSFARKVRYMTDSVFAFTDLPIRLLLGAGTLAVGISVVMGAIVLCMRVLGTIGGVPGYAATMIAILFFGGLNALGFGIVGSYAWRAYANSQRRPLAVVWRAQTYPGREKKSASAMP